MRVGARVEGAPLQIELDVDDLHEVLHRVVFEVEAVPGRGRQARGQVSRQVSRQVSTQGGVVGGWKQEIDAALEPHRVRVRGRVGQAALEGGEEGQGRGKRGEGRAAPEGEGGKGVT